MSIVWACRMGVTAAIAAGILIYTWFKLNQRKPNQSQSVPSNYHGDHSQFCSICLQEYESLTKDLIILPCKHKFHLSCIRTLFDYQGNGSCPLCRNIVSPNYIRSNIQNQVYCDPSI